MCLLLTAVLHFIHGMTEPVLLSLSASHAPSLRRHLPVLLVSLLLLLLPVSLSYFLWRQYALNTWLFAVTAFCVELCLKVSSQVTGVRGHRGQRSQGSEVTGDRGHRGQRSQGVRGHRVRGHR